MVLLVSNWRWVCAQQPCSPIPESKKTLLAAYAKKKLKVPQGISLSVAETSYMGDTCYTKLRLVSKDEGKPFQAILYLTPDQRFLTRDLFDSAVDPVEEEKRKQEEFRSALMNGRFAALGPTEAAVTLVLFSDFQCPYCKRAAGILSRDVVPAEAPHVKLIFRHLPLPMHSWARTAAEAATCAGFQGEEIFWKLHDFIFAEQENLQPENIEARISAFAEGIPGLDIRSYRRCLDQKLSSETIGQDIHFAAANDITATPTLFINGYRVREGIVSAEQLRTLIRQRLRAVNGSAASGSAISVGAPRR